MLTSHEYSYRGDGLLRHDSTFEDQTAKGRATVPALEPPTNEEWPDLDA